MHICVFTNARMLKCQRTYVTLLTKNELRDFHASRELAQQLFQWPSTLTTRKPTLA